MRKKLFRIQIIQTILILILLLVAILEKNGVIQRKESFMGFYVFSCLIYWFILTVIISITMHKNQKKEKKILKVWIVLTIEILLLAIFCGFVDKRVDMLEFTKHCKETTATIYDIDKRTRSYLSSAGENERYTGTVTYTYSIKYYVDGLYYTAYFSDTHRSSGSSFADAEYSAETNHKPRHKIGDEFTIYYNTENPEDWRRDIGYFPDKVLNIVAFIIIGLRGFILGKSIVNYNKEKKESLNKEVKI